VHANIGILVPKPFTPMQWVPFMDEATIKRHIDYVREAFKYVKGVRITWADYGLAKVESFYSRGDRAQSALIYEAYKRGQVFESFGEHFSFAGWSALWDETGWDQSRLYDLRELDEVFPWDFIHAGANKGYLKNEYKKMFKEDAAPVPDCKWGDCQKCGIPGNGVDTQLAADPVNGAAKSYALGEIAEMVGARRARNSDASFAYHIVYQKSGLSRFIAHQNTLDLFEKAFRRLRLPLRKSQGFNPKPLMKNTGALPLGLESRRELLVVEFTAAIADVNDTAARLSECLPDGMTILSLNHVALSRTPRITNVLYRLEQSRTLTTAAFEAGLERLRLGLVPQGLHRDKPLDAAAEILESSIEDGDMRLRLRCGESGSTVSPYAVFGLVLGLDPEDLRGESLVKEDFTIDERPAPGPAFTPKKAALAAAADAGDASSIVRASPRSPSTQGGQS
jgi:radical SAM-linked protein